jgi:pimeloyl-ACP methyl ester carboxylesterase
LNRAAEIFLWIASGLAATGVYAQQRPATTANKPTAAVTHAVSLEGDWSGVLQVGETELQLVLHLLKDPQGEWHAKLDSLNQAVYGIDASKVTREENSLRLEIASVGAKFQGKIQPDQRTIRGLWEQGGTGLPLKFEKRAIGAASRSAASAISKAEGTWQGAIEVTNMRMRLQMRVGHDDKGKLLASIDSLDQGIQGIPASKITEKNGELSFEIPAFQAEYRGTLSASKNELAGEWTQNDSVEKLDFRRSDEPLELRRPQNPAKPYPYAVEEVSFSAGDGKATLAGTLTMPQGAGPFAAAVLIGEGPADRDATIAGHKPFLVLADLLTRKGIVVLRYDKRGTAQSTGNSELTTMGDLASDAGAALTYLKVRKEVDGKHVGIIGLGEGGILAAQIAARSTDLDWLVLLAAPATSGEQTLLRQSELIARTGGLPEEQIAQSQQFDRTAYAAVREEKDASALEARLNALIEKSGLSASMPPAALQAQIHLMTTPWFRQYLDFNPEPVLQAIKCPVLALNGDRDLQVDADETVPLLRQAYEKSGNPDFTVMEIQGVNHLFQKAQSGSPALYGAIEETMSPEVQNAISGWVAKHSAQ